MTLSKKAAVPISLVTTCKGRLSYLRESIETWIDLEYDDYDIVIVDYDCPDGAEAYIHKHKQDFLRDSRARDIRVVKVPDKPYFNLNDARNHGIDAAECTLAFMIDSDVHIRDKKILQKITRRYREGGLFFCNPAVLTTNDSEGLEFYRNKYGVDIPFHAFLPCHARDSGLTGTACFSKEIYRACGKYNPEINKYGWGSDDIEFYIRYLNYYFYRPFWDPLKARDPSGRPGIHRALERAFRQGVMPFGENTFKLFENTEEEKEKNYPNPKSASNVRNKEHIRRLFAPSCIQSEGYLARREDGGAGYPRPVMAYRRYCSFPLPPWFHYWYSHYAGVAHFNGGRLEESETRFQFLLKLPGVPLYYRWHSMFYIALIRKRLHRRNWKQVFRRALELSRRRRTKNPLQRYNVASFLKSLDHPREAVPIFQRLTRDGIDVSLRCGAWFHLGEIALGEGETGKAEAFFLRTLDTNPAHGKAREYLEHIREESR